MNQLIGMIQRSVCSLLSSHSATFVFLLLSFLVRLPFFFPVYLHARIPFSSYILVHPPFSTACQLSVARYLTTRQLTNQLRVQTVLACAVALIVDKTHHRCWKAADLLKYAHRFIPVSASMSSSFYSHGCVSCADWLIPSKLQAPQQGNYLALRCVSKRYVNTLGYYYLKISLHVHTKAVRCKAAYEEAPVAFTGTARLRSWRHFPLPRSRHLA
jgi:hypothetical protein